MTGRLVESLRGIGAIHASERLLRRVRYELSVWSDDQPSGGAKATDAVARIDGHIDITGLGEAVVLAGADTLILTIEDGRRLAFQLTSSVGGITAGGWLPRAP
jgi:hypothetical protein